MTAPVSDAASATTSASPRTIRRICPGVAPISRSSPSSRRRDATAKANVLAMTKIVMNPQITPTRLSTVCSPDTSASDIGTLTCRGAASSPPSVVTTIFAAAGPW